MAVISASGVVKRFRRRAARRPTTLKNYLLRELWRPAGGRKSTPGRSAT